MDKTLGKLISNSLKLMFDNVGNEELIINDQASYNRITQNANFNRRLVNMQPAVFTGLDICAKALAFPPKYLNPYFKGEKQMKMSEWVDDFYELDQIISPSGRNVQYRMAGKDIVLFKEELQGEYLVVYYPRCTQDLSEWDMSTELDVPDNVFNALPFWIKAVLYEIDEPEMAERAKQLFYEMVQLQKDNNDNICNEIESEYRL